MSSYFKYLTLFLLSVLGLYLTFVSVTSLFWIYKAHKNIEQKGIKNLDFSNKACVYWWFVPILSLWKPYYIVKEIFLASKFANDWKDKSALFLII
ncbi:Uncharacterised protein [Haemophilus influenzae]|uniref:DUF4328 domain-containing protein n=1 Tax=Haemophilus influenzae TaxID=727 RepID=UPI00076664C2|nr:DUF4328 domain-containing protein [Haemophilus influenzae]AWP55415.1 DUF4328 domain-containing protein [Haemophilus influenzae]MCK8942198.1 DUF4328 domain-containing protein [Haemophilus influenzae]MCK8948194.1 DUF4328 domain-containing protein [Haemophilus influenzae]PRJ94494.1 hypothetical protein BV172_00243 [Haemophilus influenzae]PRK59176.1 hypothetical protein BV171_00124 [Haemophilus influenzae]